jgi:hypothetical protein
VEQKEVDSLTKGAKGFITQNPDSGVLNN